MGCKVNYQEPQDIEKKLRLIRQNCNKMENESNIS